MCELDVESFVWVSQELCCRNRRDFQNDGVLCLVRRREGFVRRGVRRGRVRIVVRLILVHIARWRRWRWERWRRRVVVGGRTCSRAFRARRRRVCVLSESARKMFLETPALDAACEMRVGARERRPATLLPGTRDVEVVAKVWTVKPQWRRS